MKKKSKEEMGTPEIRKVTDSGDVSATRSILDRFVTAKLGLADLHMNMKTQEELVFNLNKEYYDIVGELAKKQNIDLSSPTAGKWNFDPDTMSFTRVG